jgi:hypothetical protein
MKTKFTFLFLYVLLCCPLVKAQSDLQNGSFELWRLKEFIGTEKCCGRNIDEPYYWGMSEQLTGINYNKFVFRVADSTQAHSGLCAVQLYSDTTYFNNLVLAPGIIAYGGMTDSASTAITLSPEIRSTGLPLPFNSNPISLNFFMLTDHAATDTPYYMCLLTKWDSIAQTEDTLAYNRTDIPDNSENGNQWIEYTDTIHYITQGTADTIRILFFGGRFGNPNLIGNNTYLDDVSLYYPATGLVSLSGQPVVQVFPNPASNLLTVKTGQYKAGNIFHIFDAEGRSVNIVPVETETTTINISQLQAGNYFYRLADKANTMLSQGKFVVLK